MRPWPEGQREERAADSSHSQVLGKTEAMRASVVIPAFNAARTVERAVAAGVSQGVEVIVCDDGSTDETAEVAQRAGAVVLRLPHRGQSHARNAGIDRTSSDVVVFCDADDWLADDAVSRMLAAFEPEVGVVAGRVEVVGEAEPRWWPNKDFAKDTIGVSDLLSRNYIALGSAAISTDLVRELRGFDPSLDHATDHDLWIRAAARTRIRFIPDVLAYVDRSRPSFSSDRRAALSERIEMLQRLAPDVATKEQVLPAIARTAEDLARISTSPFHKWLWKRRAAGWRRQVST